MSKDLFSNLFIKYNLDSKLKINGRPYMHCYNALFANECLTNRSKKLVDKPVDSKYNNILED